MKALLQEKLDDQKVRCHLCGHRCLIGMGKRGICGVRENRDGVLETLVFGKLIAKNIDPIEKKPLFHLIPGSLSYSIATVGCNFKCRFCQNADIAQMPSDRNGLIMGSSVTPEQIVADAENSNCKSIAYTYTEPTVFFEFAFETAKLAHQRNIKNVFVTNGYMTPEALDLISPFLDAANVDLKAFSEKFYKTQCGAKLEPVKETIVKMRQLGIFVEVTTLLIPGLNDDPDELALLAEFLCESAGSDTPWHISRFHPTYRLTDRQPTPVQSLIKARDIGKKTGLRYVYTGNVPGDDGEKTYCYQCGKVVIDRWGFTVNKLHLHDGCCEFCHAPIDGVGL